MARSRTLLDLIVAYVQARAAGAPEARLQEIAQQVDVALGEAIIELADHGVVHESG